jgi:hypothetical protein
VYLREGDTTRRSISVAFDVVQAVEKIEKASGGRASGTGADFSSPYSLCLGSAPDHYTLNKAAVKFWLTGDRSCGSYSHCEQAQADDNNVCYNFALQGHSEDGSSRTSEGHLEAQYNLKAPTPVLR